MKQVRTVLEIPRDMAYSRLYETFYVFPTVGAYNFNTVYDKVFLEIDDSLVGSMRREVENQ